MTALNISKLLPNSFIFDPEQAGYYVRENIPDNLKKYDFQDHSIWRLINRELIRYIDSEYQGNIIIPMTISNESYFNEITEPLIATGKHFFHFTLLAELQTIKERIGDRDQETKNWCLSHYEKCSKAFKSNTFKEFIHSDKKDISDITKLILDKCTLKKE